MSMANTLSNRYTASKPISMPSVSHQGNVDNVALVFGQNRRFPGAVAATLVLLVANTTTEVAAARPTTIDVRAADTISRRPKAVSVDSALNARSPCDHLITRVRELGMLEDGWHRPDSIGATSSVVNDAELFLRAQDWHALTKPHISLTEDGEMNFLWQSETLYLDLGFVGEGTYTYFGKASDGEVFLGDDIPLAAPLPERLRSLMGASKA